MELIVSDTAMIERVLPLTGRDILDIGCGDGSLAVVLAKKGARPRGVDPQLEMIAALDRNLPGTGCVATADALPFPDGTFDGAIFFNSLHHVPSHLMALSLTEAWRVLRPEGRLVIFEPMAEGPYFEVVRLVEDETEVRALARAALAKHARSINIPVEILSYVSAKIYSDITSFESRMIKVSPERAESIAHVRQVLAKVFAEKAEPSDRGVLFRQPMEIHIFHRND